MVDHILCLEGQVGSHPLDPGYPTVYAAIDALEAKLVGAQKNMDRILAEIMATHSKLASTRQLCTDIQVHITNIYIGVSEAKAEGKVGYQAAQ